ncbi:hypothetical protein [Dysgonomonas sp. 25]|uniref:hypothetical protein n=1 Tax=Dysgonomonas sp. 25 TaxID=2302933 RepID=UPI0013CFFB3C|nr:hypothetical protein [Dysgonomonas sp. 25]
MAIDHEYKTIYYKELALDPENPRIPASKHNMDERDIIDYMLLEAATLELMQAIGENDFFRGEQLLVVPDGNKYKVLEGNRRLTSIKLLNEPELASVKKASVKEIYDTAKFHPQHIPCLIFNSEEEIRKYLGFRHITGIKPWGLTEKSRYLYQLYKDQFQGDDSIDVAVKDLAKKIGSRKDYVKRVIVAYEIYQIVEDEGFYRIKDLDDTTFYVGYIVDSLSRSHISAFLNVDMSSNNPLKDINKANLKELIFWFFKKNDQDKTRIKGKSGDLNKLNAILENTIASSAFREGKDLESAYELTDNIESRFFTSIQNSLNSLEQADSLVHKVTDFYGELEADLVQIRKLTSKIKQSKDELLNKEIFGDGDEF